MDTFDHSLPRRTLLKGGLAALGLMGLSGRLWAGGVVAQGFENGLRELVAYPQKRPMLRITTRPVHLETPFELFDQQLITPNDAVFVRYHLANHPLAIDEAAHTLTIKGEVQRPLQLTVAQLKRNFAPVSVTAVMQCAGNGRGLFNPRVPGAQLGNGSMACVTWTGVRLVDVLKAAGIGAGASQIVYRGTDAPALPVTPPFERALDIADATQPDVLIAWAMNGQPLPVLNGFPIRLVVPGYYSSYWMKHLSEITVSSAAPFTGFFANEAYTVPDTPDYGIAPGSTPEKTVRLKRMKVRAFITNLRDGVHIPAHTPQVVRGIAFDGGSGIRRVEFSTDQGHSWHEGQLGQDLGRFAFRPWHGTFTPADAGPMVLMARATSNNGEIQPLAQPWNPGGYARNVVEPVHVTIAA